VDTKKGAAIAVGLAGVAAAAYYFLTKKIPAQPGTYLLTVQVEGGSGDQVTVEIENVSGSYTATEGSPVQVKVPAGAQVTLYAQPAQGDVFSSWEGVPSS